MVDVIIPTWQEVNGWVFLLIALLVAILVWGWRKDKEEERKAKRTRDWEEY